VSANTSAVIVFVLIDAYLPFPLSSNLMLQISYESWLYARRNSQAAFAACALPF
jgi:hypothetical protein